MTLKKYSLIMKSFKKVSGFEKNLELLQMVRIDFTSTSILKNNKKNRKKWGRRTRTSYLSRRITDGYHYARVRALSTLRNKDNLLDPDHSNSNYSKISVFFARDRYFSWGGEKRGNRPVSVFLGRYPKPWSWWSLYFVNIYRVQRH